MRVNPLVCAVLIGVLAAGPVQADNCRRSVCTSYSPPYTPPVVAVVPGFDVVVPYAVPVAIVPTALYAVSPEIVTGRLIAIASQDAARQAVAEFAARYGIPVPVAGAPVAPGPGPQPQPPAQPPPPPTGGGAVPPLATPGAVQPIPPAKGSNPNGGTALATAQTMAAESCVKCHKPGASRMQLDFGKLTRPQLLEVKHRLTTSDPKVVMPPPGDGRKAVTDAQLDAVDALLNAAPN